MRKTAFIVFTLLLSKLLSAQLIENKFIEKSTIFTETDTIECYLSYEDDLSGFIDYKLSKEDKNRDKKSIDISEVVKVKKSFDTFYKLVYNNQHYMMKKLVKVQVELYEYNTMVQGSTTMNSNGKFNSTIPYDKTIFYIQKEGVLYKIKGNKKKKLKEVLTGYSEIDEMINNLNKSTLRLSLKRIVDKYNYLIAEKSK